MIIIIIIDGAMTTLGVLTGSNIPPPYGIVIQPIPFDTMLTLTISTNSDLVFGIQKS
jgi:hypothetical protein